MNTILKNKVVFFLFFFFLYPKFYAQNDDFTSYKWTTLNTEGNVKARHESSLVAYKNKFYLLGGRGKNPVNVFNPKNNTWTTNKKPPLEMHHFQAVTYKDAIYVVGAMTGQYPKEKPLKHIWIYHPEKDTWTKCAEIPASRRRGGVGAVVYQDKLYVVCGIDFGHTSGTNNYFDSYDFKTKKWEILTKAPHIRDHFSAIVVNDKLYCIGGRNTSFHTPNNFGAFFNATNPFVDVYDFKEKKWHTLKEKLPHPTAGAGVVSLNENIIFIGGEGRLKQAYSTTQLLDVKNAKWSELSALNRGRHSGGAVVHNNKIYAIAGSPNKGGGNLNTTEVFSVNNNWKPLFNGKNLEGWVVKGAKEDVAKNFWKVENGAIVSNSLHSNSHSHVWLQTTEDFDDFELRLKFKASSENKGNSGIQVRSRYDKTAKTTISKKVHKGWMDGPQVDINPNKPWTNGFIYDETRGYTRWINPSLESWKIDEEVHKPKKVIYYKENEGTGWNDLTIICKGTHIKTLVNNVVVSDFDGSGILDDDIHKNRKVGLEGKIALQCHMNSKNKIAFKDIEIRELK